MTASAGTSAPSPLAENEVTIRPVAVLLCRSAVTTSPGKKGGESVPKRYRQQPPKVGPKCAYDAAADHVQAPQQQRRRSVRYD